MNTNDIKTDSIKLVFWFVDDDARRENVHKPLESCIRRYAESLASGVTTTIETLEPPQLTLGVRPDLAKALCWLKMFKLPHGIKLQGTHNRDIEILVYGISSWDSVKGYLGVDVEGGLKKRPFWPHLIISDVFDGELKPITNMDEIEIQAGYQFAKQFCVPRHIPCIIISSEDSAIKGCGPKWQGKDALYYFEREEFTKGNVLKTLQELSPTLLKRWWIPEFSLAVEGHKIPHTSTYQVTFTKDRKIVSVKEVSAVPYAFLYLCIYGSVLARLKNWDQELVGWDKSQCIAVSLPPTPKFGDSAIQLLPTIMELFEHRYWDKSKDEIFYNNSSRTRTTNVMNANIIHLDVPFDLSFPKFWSNDAARGNLIMSMREILTPEGMEWLTACCSLP
jgi:hypothetical protein